MTDYTGISNTQVDPEAPVTSELMTSLRDDPIAIAEGSLDAPGVTALGMARDSASDSAKHLPVVSVTAASTVEIKQGMGKVLVNATAPSNAETDMVSYTINSYTGSIRFTNDIAALPRVRLYKNGVEVYNSVTGGHTTDQTVAPGDTFKWTLAAGGGQTLTAIEYASDGYIDVPVWGLSSNFPSGFSSV